MHPSGLERSDTNEGSEADHAPSCLQQAPKDLVGRQCTQAVWSDSDRNHRH